LKKPEIILRLLRIPLDIVAVSVAFLLAYWWRSHPEWIPYIDLGKPMLLPFVDYLWFSLQAAVLIVLIFAWEKMYGLRKSYRFRKELRKIVAYLGAAFTLIILYFFLVGIQFFSRFILGVAFLGTIALMILFRLILRLIQHWFWKKGISKRRVLFVGEGKVLKELKKAWHNTLGFTLVGRLATEKRSVPQGNLRILGVYEEFEQVIKKHRVDEVVQVSNVKKSAEIVEYCQLNHIEYRFVPDMLEVQRTNTELDFVYEIPIITLRSSAIDWWARIVKRIIDVVGAIVGLVLLSPFFAYIAIRMKVTDPGPVFYRSKRVSRNRNFWMWKFRTMVVDADKLKESLLKQNQRSGPLFKIDNDPRITKFGSFLRRSSMDEFPQLWNVLKGDLSLVGPRPHLPEEIEQYEKHHRKVLTVKAGVTGLAQVSGRSQLDFEQEVKLDVYYIENWSLWLDIKIIIRTFGVLVEGE